MYHTLKGNNTRGRIKIMHWSVYGLALFLFLTPFEYPLAELMSVSPLRLVGIAALAMAFLDILLQRKIKLDSRFVYMFFWLVYGMITILWVSNMERFRSYFSIYANNALMFILISVIRYDKQEAAFLKKAMIGGVAALLLYMTFIPGAVTYSNFQNRLELAAGENVLDPNYLAALMLMSFGMVMYDLCYTQQKKAEKFFSVLFCGGVGYYLIMTGSRSGLIALVVILFLCLNVSWKVRLYAGIPTILLLFVVVPLLVELMPEGLADRFSLSAMLGGTGESGTRLKIWERAIASLKDLKWLFGYGVGSSQTVIGALTFLGQDKAIHNHYLAMIVETGIVGFFFVNAPAVSMLKALWNKERKMIVSFLGIIIMAFFLDVVTTKFFWSAMILLSVTYSSYIGEEKETGKGGI